MALLSECLAETPITSALTPLQIAASKQLRAISKEDIACHKEFYEHIIEERRRRNEDRSIRQDMKKRKTNNNT